MIRYLKYILALGFAISAFFAWRYFVAFHEQKRQYEQVLESAQLNQLALDTLRLKNGQLAAENGVLKLRSQELSAILPDLIQEVKSLDVKLNRAQSISTSGFAVRTPASVALRDSIIYDTIRIKQFDYNDGFFQIKGSALGNIQNLDLAYTDTLVQVVYRGERERPWLWIFSPRKLMQRVSLKNPNAQIHYSKHLEIED